MFLGSAAMADETPDCRLTERDYHEIHRTLRDMRQDVGKKLLVAGEGAQCELAVDAIAKNDPMLGIRVVPAPPGTAEANVAHALARSKQSCGAVLEADTYGWHVVEVGDCSDRPDPHQGAVTLGYWHPTGASLRANEVIAPGFSLLADAAAQLSVSRDAVKLSHPISWRLMGGFDCTRDALAGGYVGFRGGVQQVTTKEGVDASVVGQGVVGHRWIVHDLALQLGGGALVLVPTGDYVIGREMTVGPLAEVRLGLAR